VALIEYALASLVVVVVGFLWWRHHQAVVATDELARKPQLPPSPYAPSRGFKILGDNESPSDEVSPTMPKLETDGELVFSDGMYVGEPTVSPKLRHDEQWAIERSMRRVPRLRTHRRRTTRALVLGIVVLLVSVGFATGLL
jgi:type VI protein secretion system component VasF